MFSISSTPFAVAEAQANLRTPASGGYASFEGWVRDHNEGKVVSRLEYEAYSLLAVKEGERIIAEARKRFGIHSAACVHRIGMLDIGDLAVWVGVSAAHRGEAFDACRYIIDEVKTRVPIWKKEYYTDGDSGWVNCEHCASHAHHDVRPRMDEDDFYSRQTCLKEVGQGGQEKLRRSRVLVVGAGGLGSPALLYLAAAGVGHLGICEFDRLEPSNLHRQVLFTATEVGEMKAEAAATRLRSLNPHVEVETHESRLTADTAAPLFENYDLVLDCTDNFATKFLISDTAVRTRRPAIFSSVYQFEGQIQCYDPAAGSPCLRCLWPEAPQPGAIGNCAEVGVLGAVPGVFGSLQAMEALKYLLGLPGTLKHEIVLFSLLDYRLHRLKCRRTPDCPACGSGVLPATDPARPDVELDAAAVQDMGVHAFQIIDIREDGEGTCDTAGGLNIRRLPASRIDFQDLPLDRQNRYLLCCTRGHRSQYLAIKLRRMGYDHVYSLKGGMPAVSLLAQSTPT